MASVVAENFRWPFFIAHRRELVTQMRHACSRRVVATTLPRALQSSPARVDLFGIDEAHRAAASSYRTLMDRYPRAVRFGLTATPVRADGRGLSDVFDELVECATTRELIDQGRLVPYRAYEAPDEALRQLAWMKRSGGDYSISELGALMDQPRLVGDVVREYCERSAGRKAIAFAVNVKHSIHMAKAFRTAGVRAEHLDGAASESHRDRVLADLANGEIDVLCNVNLFTEGWDCPKVSCVIMARPTVSVALYLQSVGRGLRTSPDKQDLIVLDHAGNMQRHGYPDVEREWALESDVDRAARLDREEELRRIQALGFASLEEYRLEERARESRIIEGSYSVSEVATRLDMHPSSVASFAKAHGVASYFGSWKTRYDKVMIDQLVATRYSSDKIYSIIGCYLRRPGKDLNQFLAGFGIKPLLRRSLVGWDKRQIDELMRFLGETYSTSDCIELLGGVDALPIIKGKRCLGAYLRANGIARAIFGGQLTGTKGRRYWKNEVNSLLLNRRNG